MGSLGLAPAIVLVNPKFLQNVAMVLRVAASFGIKQTWYTGKRVNPSMIAAETRIPRELRMGYDSELIHHTKPLDRFTGTTPIAVELSPSAESLVSFDHPENAVYVFGPEDGTLGRLWLQHCHRVIVIPSRYSLNLVTAVAITLYDRIAKTKPQHIADLMQEPRDWRQSN